MKTTSISMKTKLAFGFFSLTFFTIILGLFSIYTFKQETNLVKKMFTDSYLVSVTVKKIHTEAMLINTSLHLLATGNNSTIVSDEVANIDKINRVIEDQFQLLLKQYQGPKQDVEGLYQVYKESFVFREKFFSLLEKGDIVNLAALMATSGRTLMEEFNTKISTLNTYTDLQAEQYHILAMQNEKDSILSLTLFLIFLSLLSIAIATRAINSITVPLKTLLSISNNISNGILELPDNKITQDIQSREDEFGHLFNAYYDTMSQIMSPYKHVIKSHRNLVEMTAEVGRLLASFDKYIIASKTNLSGEITYVSEAFVEISGYTRKELIGEPQSLVRHPDMPTVLFKELWETIQNKQVWHGEIKNRKKDGGFYWIKAHISPDIDRDGRVIGYNAIREDITLRKAFEELTNTLEDRIHKEMLKNDKKTQHMLEQSRLALMGEMLSMIAHQWRQPLASISVLSGTMTLDIELDNYDEKSFKTSLASINNLTQHLSLTIEDFRGFFKENKEENISDIKTIIENSVAIIGAALESKGIELQIVYKENPKIKTHINEIKQVILNLLKNAEDVLMEKKVEEAKISLTVQNDNEYVSIEVEDNGGGVAEDVMEKVFDPYFSTKKAKEGTGLGLYMSKTIVEEHCGGKLLLENKNDGALFSIKIPRYEGEPDIG